MFNLFDDVIDSVSDTLENFIDNPLGTVVSTVTSPVRNAIDVFDGLTEGELRLKAIASLGFDVAMGLGTNELISWYKTTL